MPPEDQIRLRHMVEALEAVRRMVSGRQRGDLDTDEMLRLALTRALEIVGEAASRVSRDTQLAVPTIPWRRLAGMRNRLIHAYFDVDRNIIWTTSTIDVPDLLVRVSEFLASSGNGEAP
jgi:uncharacterized protein with HEPN domain